MQRNQGVLRSATLLKERIWHRCFPVNFVKFLRTPFLRNTSGRLLLNRAGLCLVLLLYVSTCNIFDCKLIFIHQQFVFLYTPKTFDFFYGAQKETSGMTWVKEKLCETLLLLIQDHQDRYYCMILGTILDFKYGELKF